MAKIPSIQFYPGDWLRDEVAACSLAAQGLWLRLMIVMHDSERYGYLGKDGVPTHPEHLAKRVGCTLDQFTTLLRELDQAGVPSRTDEGIIFSRRMVRDAEIRKKAQRFGKKGGNPALLKSPLEGVKGGDNPPRRGRGRLKGKTSGEEGPGETPGESVEFFDLIPPSLRVPEFIQAWSDWISHRHQRKPKYTAEAAKRALPKLAAEGTAAAVERIDRSIANNYQGLFFQGEKTGGGPANGQHRKNVGDTESERMSAALATAG